MVAEKSGRTRRDKWTTTNAAADVANRYILVAKTRMKANIIGVYHRKNELIFMKEKLKLNKIKIGKQNKLKQNLLTTKKV